jgi:Xaa-Pro dipeptidase
MLTKEGCRIRQERLLKKMEAQSWDAFITADRRTAYYVTGFLASESAVVFVLWADGRTALISNSTSTGHAAEMVCLESYSIKRSIDFLDHDAARVLDNLLSEKPKHDVRTWTLDKPSINALLAESLRKAYPQAEFADASQILFELRKKKEEDEIAGIRENLKYCAAAYTAARNTIRPGITEIDVFNAMQNAVTQAAGTRVELPGDFACGERCISGGGPPTSRKLQSGDLYTLDIFPAANLYYADTCRTFAVGEPTELQQRGWEVTMQAVRLGESIIKPGVRARDVYDEIKAFLDSMEITEKSFWHHAGHGLGHRGHDAPRIIPGSDDVFEEGDVFALEPGFYSKALQGGIRLEDDYVVRVDGVEDLFHYPWEL